MFRPQSETVRRTRLSVQTESEQTFLGDLFYALPQM